MTNLTEIKVPDIGDYKDIPVIEIHVKVGDTVKAEQSIITLESDKATMDVPSSASGVVKELRVKLGDNVSEGTVVLVLEEVSATVQVATPVQAAPVAVPSAQAVSASTAHQAIEVRVPDIGDYKDIPVIEIHVKVGDVVKAEQSLITLESDKATMDVPSSASGVVKEVKVQLGNLVSEGSVVILLESAASSTSAAPAPTIAPVNVANPSANQPPVPVVQVQSSPVATSGTTAVTSMPVVNATVSHASPTVRKYARELGADIRQITGTGPKGRITQNDVRDFIKQILTSPKTTSATSPTPASGGLNLLPWPKVDFKKFGEIESKPLSRIQKISAANLARNWAMIPAVTYHEDADITLLESFRVETNKSNEKSGVKVTLLAFLMKACVQALKKYPEFNSSLDGDELILKKYFHLGFAADTPNGLVVPVIKDVDKKGVMQIAQETSELAKLARDGKLKPDQMQGACFTISSVGGIGGTYFAPIINAPEVAILGVSKAAMKPIWDGKQFNPKLICPLSLTADHRVIDGALATRFNAYIAELLSDFRRVTL
ncbi:dihydrolipoyllysine-residue acetyltransferase [Polynucleobacter kasalickyi]|uniref:Acetyltransferase component of pyruvate dehydrogenase complex n=1 Tax=Polynucleobacter kasalickyi TaxID=1938817 RepID=A0A1W2B283_9BURK|nr:dihydrolipoyllysine-residue acetyltransferase [Polynucleobacter kasalickyi]SMC66832.1 pyruvate dehydrogenase E2 component (dihydrolipoamide acetyltransferase) [Polynucleobacter kasalickyi]